MGASSSSKELCPSLSLSPPRASARALLPVCCAPRPPLFQSPNLNTCIESVPLWPKEYYCACRWTWVFPATLPRADLGTPVPMLGSMGGNLPHFITHTHTHTHTLRRRRRLRHTQAHVRAHTGTQISVYVRSVTW